jgi:hypothetical protein
MYIELIGMMLPLGYMGKNITAAFEFPQDWHI